MIPALPPAQAGGYFMDPTSEEYAALRTMLIYDTNLKLLSGWVRLGEGCFWIVTEWQIQAMLSGISHEGAVDLARRILPELAAYYTAAGWSVKHSTLTIPPCGSMCSCATTFIAALQFDNTKAEA